MKHLIIALVLLIIATTFVFGQQFIPMDGPHGNTGSAIGFSRDASVVFMDCNGFWRRDANGSERVLPAPGFPILDYGSVIIGNGANFPADHLLWQSTDNGVTWSSFSSSNLTPGYPITALVMDKDGNAVVGQNGLWRSMDTAKTWSYLGLGPGINGLVIQNDTFYIATATGFYRSFDNGVSFDSSSTELPSSDIRSLVYSSNGILFANVDTGPELKLYRSSDQGVTWNYADLTGAEKIALNPLTGLLFGTMGDSLVRSTDNGATWDSWDIGYRGTSFLLPASDLNGNIYLGTTLDGFLRSTDNGATWEDFGSPIRVDKIITFPAPPPPLGRAELYSTSTYLDSASTTLFALSKNSPDESFVYRSSDNGIQWGRFSLRAAPFASVRDLYAASWGDLFVSTATDTLYRSSDLGNSWIRTTIPFDEGVNTAPHSVVESSDGTLFLGGAMGIFKSTDHGSNWAYCDSAVTRDILGYQLVISRAEWNRDFLFGIDPIMNVVLVSSNSGDNWNLYSIPSASSSFTYLAIDDSGNVFVTTPNQLFKSPDNGVTWDLLGGPSSAQFQKVMNGISSNGVLALASKEENLFAGTNGSGLYKSTDGGTSWEPKNSELRDLTVPSVAISSTRYLYVGTGLGMYRSAVPLGTSAVTFGTLNGWTMTSLPITVADRRASTLFPQAHSKAFTYAGGYVVKDTLEYGEGYWLKLTGSMVTLPGVPIGLDTIPVKNRWNMIGSISVPVPVGAITSIPPGLVTSPFYTYDGVGYVIATTIEPGKSYWVKSAANGKLVLANGPVSALAKIAIRITNELPPPPPESPETAPQLVPKAFALYANYPNPFNPTTQIAFDLPKDVHVKLVVYDILGQVVARLADNEYTAGSYTVPFTGDKLASGIYFYRLEAGTFTDVKKMLLLR